jgi:hypothetical protein
MKYKLITDIEVRDLPVPEQFFQYADAYLRTAIMQCEFVAKSPSYGRWPDAAVTLLLAAHAIELFLKGAILLREPDSDTPLKAGHDISELARKFRELYPEPQFAWEVPFAATDTPPDLPKAIKYEQSMQSMVYRFPLTKHQEPWLQLSALEPTSFQADLLVLQEKFAQLQS